MKLLFKAAAMLLAFISVVSLTGCRRTDYAENQAYAVMLGIDGEEGTEVRLTVKYPKLAGSSGGSSGGGEASSYAIANSKGPYFQEALENLKAAMPREINLSALTLIVISENTVSSGSINGIIGQLSTNYRMYSSAYIAICDGEAADFIKKQEPQIGSRLSEGLKALIENAEKLGCIPDSRMADVKYLMGSVYSDPVIMRCALTAESDDEDREDGEDIPAQAEGGTVFAGAYIVRDGNIAVEFNKWETVLINAVMGEVEQFTYTDGRNAAFISVDRKPNVKISYGGEVRISIELELSAMLISGDIKIEEYATAIRDDIYSVIEKCRTAGAEPFGFAERAAGKFITIDKWLDFSWNEKFADAEINVEIEITEIF